MNPAKKVSGPTLVSIYGIQPDIENGRLSGPTLVKDISNNSKSNFISIIIAIMNHCLKLKLYFSCITLKFQMSVFLSKTINVKHDVLSSYQKERLFFC